MNNEITIYDIKSKFGALINYLIENGFRYEYIDSKVIYDSFFSFLENNDIEVFVRMPIESIVKTVFHKEIYINYAKPLKAELVWAGEIYITIAANCNVSLQQVFIQIPLSQMISLFDIYHEMSNFEMVKLYKEYKKKSILKTMLKDKKYSIRKVAFLTGINQKTLLSYLDNEKLFSASLKNIYKLSKFLNVDPCVFSEHSSFSPFDGILLKDKKILDLFVSCLAEYLNVQPEQIYIDESSSNDTKISKEYKYGFNSNDFSIIFKSGKSNRRRFLVDAEIIALGKRTIEKANNILSEGQLMF